MKRIIVFAALAAVAFSSCTKKVAKDEYGYTIITDLMFISICA